MSIDIAARERALADYLDCELYDVVGSTEEALYGEGVSIEGPGRSEYVVCTDKEADRAWDEALDSYLDECVMPEIPDNVRYYFDRDAWKRDAQFDGRGHALSSYDGSECDLTDPETGAHFVAFRVN